MKIFEKIKYSVLAEILLIYGSFFIPGSVIAGPLQINTASMIFFVTLAVPQTLLIGYILRVQQKMDCKAYGLQKPTWQTGTRIILVLSTLLALALSLACLINLIAPQVTPEYIIKLKPYHYPLLLLYTISVGYREEFFYRSYLLTRGCDLVSGQVKTAYLILGSSLMFALGHLYAGLFALLFALGSGALLCLFFQRFRDLHAIALAHALYDFLIIIFYLPRQ